MHRRPPESGSAESRLQRQARAQDQLLARTALLPQREANVLSQPQKFLAQITDASCGGNVFPFTFVFGDFTEAAGLQALSTVDRAKSGFVINLAGDVIPTGTVLEVWRTEWDPHPHWYTYWVNTAASSGYPVITSVTNPIDSSNLTNVTIVGSGPAGGTVALDISDGSTHLYPSAVLIDTSGNWTMTVDVTTLADGTLTFTALGPGPAVVFRAIKQTNTGCAVLSGTFGPLVQSGSITANEWWSTFWTLGEIGSVRDIQVNFYPGTLGGHAGEFVVDVFLTSEHGGSWTYYESWRAIVPGSATACSPHVDVTNFVNTTAANGYPGCGCDVSGVVVSISLTRPGSPSWEDSDCDASTTPSSISVTFAGFR